ncbi:hypothetical protein ES703_13800 [subsurface metagenome]
MAKAKPLTRKELLAMIKRHGGKAEGLDLSRREFEENIDLSQMDLSGILLREASLWYAHLEGANLSNAHLERAILRGAHLEGADLSGANADGIDLQGAHLEGANLSKAHLKKAGLLKANLSKAVLPDARLEGAELEEAHLDWADLSGAYLKKAYLMKAHLEGVNLSRAHLEGAYLEDASLERANLSGAHLEGANLQRADLRGATLHRAHLKQANLKHCNLRGPETNLIKADLEGAQLYAADLFQANIEGIKWDAKYMVGEEQLHKEEENDKKKQELIKEAASVYRNLKIWHTEQGMYDLAGEFFFREMTAKRKALKWRPHPFPRLWSELVSFTCGYGERPLRAIVWAASVIVGLGIIYFLIGTDWQLDAFGNSLAFSTMSFTSMGYGSWLEASNAWIKGIGAFESFIGVFTIALFLVTFVRKMTR